MKTLAFESALTLLVAASAGFGGPGLPISTSCTFTNPTSHGGSLNPPRPSLP